MRWNANFAYVVGLITSDGCLSKDGRHIDFTSKDKDQIMNFKNILKLKNIISIKNGGKKYEYKLCYRIQFGDVRLYRFLLSIGLLPNKSKILTAIKLPKKYFTDFLRGYFDGDGYSYSYWDKRWKSSFMLYVGFSSASKIFLVWVKECITKYYGINGTIKTGGRTTFNLMYAKNSSIQLIKIMYYKANVTCLGRKKYKIELALDIIRKQAGMAKLVHAYA